MRRVIRWMVAITLVVGGGYLVMNPPKAGWCIGPDHYTNRWRGPLEGREQWIANNMAEAAVRDGCYDRK